MTDVVILPGLDGTGTLLTAMCEALDGHGCRACAIRYPVDVPLGYEALEPLVRAQLPATTPFVLVGESFSGPLAVRIAADPPRGLRGLVLSTTFARAPVGLLGLGAPLLRVAPARPPLPLLAWALLGPWATPQLRRELAATLRTVHPHVLRARAEATLRVDVSERLASIGLPSLHLVASHDRLLRRSTSTALADALAGSRTVIVPGPHLLLQTAVAACAREIAGFAQDVCPADRSLP